MPKCGECKHLSKEKEPLDNSYFYYCIQYMDVYSPDEDSCPLFVESK